MQLILKGITYICFEEVTLPNPLSQKRNMCTILKVCVGEVLLKQWKQGNT